jgi:hypothetical protein
MEFSMIEGWLKVAFCGVALLGRPVPSAAAVTGSAGNKSATAERGLRGGASVSRIVLNRPETVVENALPRIGENHVPDSYELEESYPDVMKRVANLAKR